MFTWVAMVLLMYKALRQLIIVIWLMQKLMIKLLMRIMRMPMPMNVYVDVHLGVPIDGHIYVCAHVSGASTCNVFVQFDGNANWDVQVCVCVSELVLDKVDGCTDVHYKKNVNDAANYCGLRMHIIT